MSATKELCEDGKLKLLHLDAFLYPKSKQQKQSHREKQMASELSLLIWWLMWAQLVYLLTYLQKSNIPYVSSSNIVYYMYILYTQYILLPMHNTRAPGIYAVIMGSPTTIKVMPDPFQGQGAKWLMSNTAAQERVKRGSVLQLPCSLAWRHDRSARVLRGKDVSL